MDTQSSEADGGVEGEADATLDGLAEGVAEGDPLAHATIKVLVQAATWSTTKIGAAVADAAGVLTGFGVGVGTGTLGLRTKYTTAMAPMITSRMAKATSSVFFIVVLIVLLQSKLGYMSERHLGSHTLGTAPSMCHTLRS